MMEEGRTPPSIVGPTSVKWWWGMVAVATGYFALFFFFPALFPFVGVNHFGVWFLDTFAILASNDALRLGLDPYQPNPLDFFGRKHVYTHWWLGLSRFGFGRSDYFWLGLVQGIAFFAAAVAGLRPRSRSEMGWYLVFLCSTPVLLVLNRANNDLVVFLLLAPVVPCLLDQRRLVRLFPAFLIAIATGLKFYPAVAGLVLLAAAPSRTEVRVRLTVVTLLLAVVGCSLIPDFARMGSVVPKAEGLMTFGLVNFLAPLSLDHASGVIALAFVGLIGAVFYFSSVFHGWEIPAEHRADWLRFVLAAALLTGCYLTGTNYAYRWIFSLWLAPFLWRISREHVAPAKVRKLARLTGLLLVVMLWMDPAASFILTALKKTVPGSKLIAGADIVFLIEQPLAMACFVCLIGWLAYFCRERIPAIVRRG